MIKHSSPISGISAFSKKYIATAGYDNCIILWDAIKHTAIMYGVHNHLVNQCQFSHDGKYLASSSSDNTVRLWSVPDMKLLAVMNDHMDDVEGIAFNPLDTLLSTASRDHHIRVYDLKGKLQQTLSGHKQDVLSVTWLNDTEIISSSDDGSVKRWDALNGELLETVNLGGVETDTIAITEQGIIFAGNDLGEIIVIAQNNQQKIKAHQAGIKKLCFSSKQQMLVSLSYDRSLIIWIVEGLKLTFLKSTKLPAIVWARSADFLSEHQLALATFGSHYAIYDFSIDSWKIDHIYDTSGINAILMYRNDLYSIGDAGILMRNGVPINKMFSLCNFLTLIDGDLITGGQMGSLFDGKTRTIIYQHKSPLNCAIPFYKNAELHVIVGTYTGEGLIFKKIAQSYQLVAEIQLHQNAIKSLATSDRYLYSVCADSAAAFHNINDFKLVKYIPNAHTKIVNACAWYEGDTFVSVSRDLTLRFTSLQSQQILKTPHKNSIKCLAISDDRRFIATGGYHGVISVLDTAMHSWSSYRPTISGISCLIYDGITKEFRASSYDGKIYSVPSQNCKERLQCSM